MEPEYKSSRSHYAILAIWPLLLTLINRNWAYGDLHNYDGWYYFGDFLHFPRIHMLAPEYPHERVVWILAGSTLVRLFGMVWGLFVLHYLTVWSGLCLMYYIVRRAADTRTALLGTVMLGCSSAFLGPNGWAYPDGLLLICVLGGVALLVRRPEDHTPATAAVMAAGAALALMMNLYLLWGCLVPAYLFLMLRVARGRKFHWPAQLRVIGLAAAGAISAGFVMWGLYLAMGGRGFFMATNLSMARYIGKVGNIPWVQQDWMHAPVWLVLPALALSLAIIGLVEYRSRRGGLSRTYRDLMWFYLLCLAILVALTISPTRILAMEIKLPVIVPVVFLIFALVVFRVPPTTPDWLFCATGLLAASISLTTLAVPDLYRIAYRREFLIPAFALLLAVNALRIWRPASSLRWSAGVVLFALACFGIVPSYYRAWLLKYGGPDIVERVVRGTRVVLARLPEKALPAFWFQDNSDDASAEFQGIMCAFMGGPRSLLNFPKVDRPLTPGTRIFLMRERSDEAPIAKKASVLAGTALTEKSRDRIAFGGTAYWIIQFEVETLNLAAVHEGFMPVPGEQAVDFGGATLRRLRLEEAGNYHFELRYPRGKCTSRFGAVSQFGAPVQQAGTPAPDGGDEIAWFRMPVAAGDVVGLNTVWTCTAGAQPAASKFSVWRDPSSPTLSALDLTRQWTGSGSVKPGSGCHGGGCVEFVPVAGQSPYLHYRHDLGVKPDVTYELTAWLRSGAGKPIRMECGMWDAAHATWNALQNFTATAEWSSVRVRFQSGADKDLIPAFKQSLGDTGSIFVDDLEIKPSPRVETTDSLIPNGSFENGLAGWDSLKGKIREASDCHRGSCVEFLPLGTEMQYVVSWAAFAPVPGKTYEFSAWIRSGTGKPLRMQWGFWEAKANQWVAPQTYTATPEWTKVTNRFHCDTHETLSPIFWQSQGDFGSMFIDEVELREVK